MRTVVRLLFFLLCAAIPFFAQQAPAPPAFRLGDRVTPTHYSVALTIIPEQEAFSGVIDMDLNVRQPSSRIWMHGVDLKVRKATVTSASQAIAAQAMTARGGYLGFTLEHPIAAGKAALHVEYDGALNSKSSAGLFRNQVDGAWYAYSQFEATDARRAFPCFDEPSFKVPWQVTLHVKKENAAFSNTPILSEAAEANGMKAVRFGETRPLPSYLVAMAVGPFETVDAGKAGRNGVPVRIVVARGRTADAGFAAQATVPIVNTLEQYFGIPYAYPKLDIIAVPLFFGAMENPGLVTFAQTLVVAKREDQTIGFKRAYASVAAHELAHMWFGDLVTTAWWDDIWLNEAFATWLESKIVEMWKPEWHFDISAAAERQRAMGDDSLLSARRIRQPIESENDIANAFDGITYQKGAAVIHMFEHWIGTEKFRQGVQLYMRQHADGNATAADFLSAVSTAAGRDIAPAFSSFLNQAGVPLVSARLTCTSAQPPTLALSQKRYLPLGSKATTEQTWQIPVCVKYRDDKGTHSECQLLDKSSGEFHLTSDGCPQWVLLNEEEAGYFRTLYQGDMLAHLTAGGGAALDVPERLEVIGDVQAEVQSGDLPVDEALRLVPVFAGDAERHVVEKTIDIVAGIEDHLVPSDLRPNYQRYIEKVYGERARKLGWQPKPGEDDNTRMLRDRLVTFAANAGGDRQLSDEAVRMAYRWLTDRNGIAPDMIGNVLYTAARHGDRKLYDAFRTALAAAKDEQERRELLDGLGAFRNPELVRENFRLMLSSELDPRESFGLLTEPVRDPAMRSMPFEFVKASYDAVVAKLPTAVGNDMSAYLPFTASGFCDDEHYKEAQSFFKERSAKAVGGPRILDQVLESIHQCSVQVEAEQGQVAAFLRSQ